MLGIASLSPRLVAASAYRVRDRLAGTGCHHKRVDICVSDTAMPQYQCDNPQRHDSHNPRIHTEAPPTGHRIGRCGPIESALSSRFIGQTKSCDWPNNFAPFPDNYASLLLLETPTSKFKLKRAGARTQTRTWRPTRDQLQPLESASPISVNLRSGVRIYQHVFTS